MLIFSTVRRAKSCLPRNLGSAPNSNIPDHIRSARTSKTARITQRTGRLKGLNRLLERALPVGWVLQGRPCLRATPTGSIECCCHRCPLEVPAWRACPAGQKDTDVQTRDCASLKNSRECLESQRGCEQRLDGTFSET